MKKENNLQTLQETNMTRRLFFKCLASAPVFLSSFSLKAKKSESEKKDLSHLKVKGEEDLLKKKDGLKILNNRPINAETPPHLLDDGITPTNRLFVRNNGFLPNGVIKQHLPHYKLAIDGEVENPLMLSLDDIKKKFKHYTYQLVLECGGNGRAAFYPPTPGNKWSYGAVGCPLWKGVRLRDVLELAKVKKSAIYTAYYGLDEHLSGDEKKVVISRGTPLWKAMEETTLLAFELNGKTLPPLHGFPLRLICPGFPGSTSGKWLKKITLRDQVHDGPKMKGYAYRLPKNPVSPGSKVKEEDMVIIEKMPVKSLITHPKSGTVYSFIPDGKAVEIRGHAWTGEDKITQVHVSYDFGQTWQIATLKEARNKFAWQDFSVNLRFPKAGYYEIWAKATDNTGRMQPMVLPGWNPKGYLNNAMSRIAIQLT